MTPTAEQRPRITPLQRDILTKIADGWHLCCDGAAYCWLQSSDAPVHTVEEVPMHTAERLVLRNLVHPNGSLLPDGRRAIGREEQS